MTEYNKQVAVTLAGYIKARFPYIYIPTWEEERAIELIKEIAGNADIIKTLRKVFVWSQTEGFVCDSEADINTFKPVEAIDFIASYKEHAVFILKDFHVFFGNKNRTAEYTVIRKLRDINANLKTGTVKKTVIFISPELNIPDDMQKEITVFNFPLPTVKEIEAKLEEMICQNSSAVLDISPGDKEVLSKAALGLTLNEAENAFARAIVNNGKLGIDDLTVIFDEKNQVIKKSGILEFIKTDLSIDDIGGLDNLKRWLQKRNNSWLDSAKKYNIPSPKGVLITGVPGCGKSLTAKAMSAIWKLPLLNLDIGKIFSGIVGSSEENMRHAIQTAEAVAPSILWVDEIEKGFGDSSIRNSEISTRVFGTFLTWMQDKTAPVFVIATANNINSLPPELLRKGRFDEIFFVDLPTYKERKEIFKLHLNKRLKNPEIAKNIPITDQLLNKLAELTEGFVGAEIEQIVISALYEAFFEDRELLEFDLRNVIKNMVPLSVTQKEQIKALRDWANVRAVAANDKDDLREYKYNESTDDISKSRGGRIIDFSIRR